MFTWDKREQFEELERLLVQTGLEDRRHLLLDLGEGDLRRGQAVGVLQRVILEPGVEDRVDVLNDASAACCWWPPRYPQSEQRRVTGADGMRTI